MSDKIIDEVMGLVKYACDSYAHLSWCKDNSERTEAIKEELEQDLDAIRTKLREVLERKPMQEGEIFNWWRGENGFEDHDMCKLQDFSEIVRAVEKRHNIK